MTKDEALKMAIEAIEGMNYDAYGYSPKDCKDNETIQACKEALAQPAQEPVAVITPDNYGEPRLDFIGTFKYKATTAVNPDIPLYTHPAPSWQGLSDDEIQNIADETDKVFATSIFWVNAFARAIEQALKEKNA